MTFPLHYQFTLFLVKLILILAPVHTYFLLRRFCAQRRLDEGNRLTGLVLVIGLSLAATSDLFHVDRLVLGTTPIPDWWRLMSSVWVAGSFGAYLLYLCYSGGRWLSRRANWWLASRPSRIACADLQRRQVLTTLASGVLAAPFVAAGYGTFIARRRFELYEVDLPIAGLPFSLEGIRVALLTDIHMGPYLSAADLEYVVAMTNETRPHLAVVTGDFITGPNDPLIRCLDILSRLKADAGIRGCLGNHEIYAKCESECEEYGRSIGIRFLRLESEEFRFGDATLNLCGVDYQRSKKPYLAGGERLVRPGALNLLLSHNPDVFPVAARMGYELVLSGHTHGGQVNLEIVEQWANPALFFTPYVAGEYRLGESAIYVSRGIGTVNLPMRIGVPPEITLIRLVSA